MPSPINTKILILILALTLAVFILLAGAALYLYKTRIAHGPTQPPAPVSPAFPPSIAPSAGIPNLDQIRLLPEGLTVTHTPNPVRPFREDSAYTWVYETKVTSKLPDKTLTVVEFGGFSSNAQHPDWLFTNETGSPFTSKNFAQWFDCPGAQLKSGQSFTNTINSSSSDHLVPSRSLWYFIAQDADGKRYRGEATLEFSDQITTPPPSVQPAPK